MPTLIQLGTYEDSEDFLSLSLSPQYPALRNLAALDSPNIELYSPTQEVHWALRLPFSVPLAASVPQTLSWLLLCLPSPRGNSSRMSTSQ